MSTLASSAIDSRALCEIVYRFSGPCSFLPQQVTLPSALIPQVNSPPAEIWTKESGGGLACPKSFFPTQVTLPLRRSPQSCALGWSVPTESCTKAFAATFASVPRRCCRRHNWRPTGTCKPPALPSWPERRSCAVSLPRFFCLGGGHRAVVAHGSSVSGLPQHVMLPSLSTPQASTAPRERWVNAPVGEAIFQPLGEAVESSAPCHPQQAVLPSACSPQVVVEPSEISVKASAGGSLSLRLLAPQHAALPSRRSAQL
jgi:hypothetical protein